MSLYTPHMETCTKTFDSGFAASQAVLLLVDHGQWFIFEPADNDKDKVRFSITVKQESAHLLGSVSC